MIVLTGSQGFIGSHFKNCLSSLIEVDMDNCLSFINNFDRWDEVTLIIHQGAVSSTTETDIQKINQFNVYFTLELFKKAIEFGIPVKYASSASVYGNKKKSFNPLNQYAISKLQIDYWVTDNIDRFSSIQGFRYFNVYGSGEEHKGDQASPVSKFSWQARDRGIIKLFTGSENFYRDFVCVEDIIEVVLNNYEDSGIFDLGTSNPVSFKSVAESVAEKYNADIQLIDFPHILKGKYQDYTCAKEEFPYKSFITVEQYING